MQEASDPGRTRLDSMDLSNCNDGVMSVGNDKEEAVVPSTITTATHFSSVNIDHEDNDETTMENDNVIETPMKVDVSYLSWAEVLKTPSAEDLFSPTRHIQKPGSLHGLGMS
jgi:hypothetical protein